MDELLFILNSIYPLPEDLREHLKDILRSKVLAEGDLLLKSGHYCENVYFVSKGLFRSYYYDKKDTEVNKWFMKEGDVVFAVRSFLNQIPSKEFIQALAPSTVFYISYSQLQQIYKEHITFNFNSRVLVEKYYKLCEEREEIMRMPKAVDRYNYMLENFSELMNLVPDKFIASFLRMTPVSFSRLRNQRTTKGKLR